MTHATMYSVEIHYGIKIPVRDGLLLSANLFMPVPRREGERFPAILEMIPYRKDDWRYISDHRIMTYLAQRGFAGCRLDVRGTGSSPGIAMDEYTPAETQDGVDAVEWLAGQPWSNGFVGMWGISYGGFTAIQVAMQDPPALKAIAPVYASDDRYTDDVHYIGGCMVASELAQYAVSQIGMNAMPPHPEHAGPDWQEIWRQRLEETPLWFLEWLKHPRDSEYWRSGSLRPDYARIRCPIFLIGGWNDGYTNSTLRMLERCDTPRRAVIGNWVHAYPHNAYPGPHFDWLSEMVEFFDRWLNGRANAWEDKPRLVYFRREFTRPEAFPKALNGEWLSLDRYSSESAREKTFYLHDGVIDAGLPDKSAVDPYPHRPTAGVGAGACWGAGAAPNGLARDLRPEEGQSLTFTSAPLDDPLDILGFPKAVLHLAAEAPVAHAVVRLADVAPDGTSVLVSTGILNLAHRDGHRNPTPLRPGEVYPILISMKATGYRFLAGHRLRLSLSSAYWPVIWPSPYPGMTFLYRGGEYHSRIVLPVPRGCEPIRLKESPPALIQIGEISSSPPEWLITRDVIREATSVTLSEGDQIRLPWGATLTTSERLVMTARDQEPERAKVEFGIRYSLVEEAYQVDIEAEGLIESTLDTFTAVGTLKVGLDGRPFFEENWAQTQPRDLL